jgi:hypothetical protein
MKCEWKKLSAIKKEKYMRVFGKHQSTLRARLLSKILYHYFVNRDGDLCYRCGKSVTFGDHSLDHDNSFWDASDPWEAFFDLNQCYLSHRSCNYRHGSQERDRMNKERFSKSQKKQNILRGMYERSNSVTTGTESNPNGDQGQPESPEEIKNNRRKPL